MPGINAMVAPYTRPDLVRSAPWRRWLPVMGGVWLVFGGIVYWFAGIDPIVQSVKHLLQPHAPQSLLSYLNTSGVSFTLGVAVVGIVIYVIRNVQNRAQGIDLSLLYKQVPPD